MRLDQPLFDLGQRMIDRKAIDDPYVLLLGQGCGAAAGVPALEEIALRTCETIMGDPPDSRYRSVIADHVSEEQLAAMRRDPDMSREPLMEAFNHVLGIMPPMVRANLIAPQYSDLPVSRFYLSLARMIRDRYFYRVFTANIDTLLEQALEKVDMRQGIDFDVVNVLSGRSVAEDWRDRLAKDRVPCVVKLYGDAAGDALGEALSNASAVNALLRPSRFAIKQELGTDLLVVGYGFESPFIDKAFYAVRELWWVNESHEHAERILDMVQDRARLIAGEGASPTDFFPNLRGVLDLQSRGREQPMTTAPTDLQEPMAHSDEPVRGDVLAEIARNQLIQSRTELAQTRRRLVSGGTPDLTRQFDYERRQVMDLENQVRRLTWTQEEVRRALRGVADLVSRSTVDSRAATYLRSQADAVEEQFQSAEPNEFVVTAALQAAARVADSLGPDAIDRKLVDELRSMAHGGAMGVDYGEY